MFDIISIGDSAIDNILNVPDAEVSCSLHTDRCVICLNYAEKIIVEKMQSLVAGNAANNAVGSARLGLKTALYTILGDDGSGERIKETLLKEKVSPAYIIHDPRLETNSSVVINFHGERTILAYHGEYKYRLPKLSRTKWLYYTSVGKNHARLNREVAAYVKLNNAKLVYNPDSFQLLAGLGRMKPVLAVSEIIFVNKEEAGRIVGAKPEMRPLLLALYNLGPKIAVITDGANGSFAFDGQEFWTMGVFETPVVEKTGAGDAFATGFLAARHYRKTIGEAMCWGTVNAATVIMKYGPQAGLLTRAGLQKFHRERKHRCAVTF